MENPPLVSVIVISYNSSKTIIETLESIKQQTYQNLELIVSDDCSSDDTKSVVTHWLEDDRNTSSFVRAIQTNTPKNGGPAINCNHGIRISNGKWFKLIAADDLLLPDCIRQNVEYVIEHNDSQILISRMVCFRDSGEVVLPMNDVNWAFWKLTRKQQYHMMVLDNWITAPSQFVRRDVWDKLNGFDESMPFIEDWPFWIKSYRAGIKFGYIDIPTVKYRLHDSLSRARVPSQRYIDSQNRVNEYVHRCQYRVSPFLRFYSYTRDSIKNRIIKIILFALNPSYWYIRYIRSLMSL